VFSVIFCETFCEAFNVTFCSKVEGKGAGMVVFVSGDWIGCGGDV